MMKKLRFGGLALVAVLAMFAVVASAAFSTEFLLNGNPVAAGDLFDAEGELELSDLNVPLLGEVSVLCSGILDGKFTSSTKGEVTEVLNLAGEKIGELGGLSIPCTNVRACAEPLLFADKLPWPAVIELEGTAFLLDLGSEVAGAGAAYEIECMTISQTDLCEGLTLFTLTNGTTDVLVQKNLAEDEAEKTAKELGTCTLGGANQGDVLTQGESLILDPTGTLQVS